ncbi:hypothetical protein [uncultured Ruegeria sp.]|uniref:hypothetical protein n=1 Tax=uncultured Ruegeria sp. TaxID=259304 RepID=UPI002616CBA4|nr:hypothetical protein [uncultured Ruegeria sp.]
MFSILGFTPICRLWDEIPAASFNKCYETGLQFPASDPGYALSVTASDWLEVKFFSCISDNMHICGPDGTCLKIDFRCLRHDDLTIHDLALHEEGAKLLGPDIGGLGRALRLFSLPEEDFIDDALRCSKSYWSAALDLGLQHEFISVPLFHTRNTYTISLHVFDLLDELNYMEVIDFKTVVQILRPFSGWALCVPDSFIESSWDEYWRQDLLKGNAPSKPVGPGRPRLIEKALRDLRIVFGDSIEGLTIKQIVRGLEGKTGNRYSESTLRRAMRQNSRQN